MNNYNAFKLKLLKKALERKVPIAGEFELTSNCNMNCKMCYVHIKEKTKDLSNKDWLNIITEAKQAGMLFATLTGGEIFQRKNFMELYNDIYDLGVKIVLYTNGTVITNDIIIALQKKPPEYMAITIYGDSKEMYDEVCQFKNGFEIVCDNIKKLKDAGIDLVLRTVPIKDVFNNLDKVLDKMISFKLPIENSLYVAPNRTADKNVSEYRLTPKELLLYQKKFEEKLNLKYTKKFVDSENGFNCMAGRSAFFVNWQGEMSICSLFDRPALKILKTGFPDAWVKLQEKVLKNKKNLECSECIIRDFCYVCPAKLFSEGNSEKCSKYLYLCAMERYVDKNGEI